MTDRPGPLSDDELSPEMREHFDRWRLDGQLYNVFRLLSRNPNLARAWTVFGAYVFGRTGLTLRQSELLILRTAWLSGADYEYAQHVATSNRRRVLDDDDQRALIAGPGDPHWSREDAALLQAADDIDVHVRIADPTWTTLAETFSPEQILDIAFTCGAYRTMAAATNSFELPLDGSVPVPARLPSRR